MCGSRGLGAEGFLLDCVQCGQTYHPYCLTPAVSLTVHARATEWRCPQCAACDVCWESCGKPDGIVVSYSIALTVQVHVYL
jgi:hypothetical protein